MKREWQRLVQDGKITFIRRPNALGTWGRPPYTVTRETARDPQTYYLPLSAETARRLMPPQRSGGFPTVQSRNNFSAC